MVTPVSITHTFNGDIAASDLVNAADLDTQLSNLASTVNAEIAERQRTVRDGSGLAPQVVRFPSLHPEITALLTAGGLIPLQAAAALSVSNVATLSGLQTIDGYTLLANDRVLLVGQSNSINNGLWLASAGAWTRPSDSANNTTLAAYTFVSILNGTTQTGSTWYLSAESTVSLTAQSWVIYSGIGTVVSVARGGTGADTAAGARANLGSLSISVDTVAAMTALTGNDRVGTVIVRGRATKGDGGGGEFYWDAASAATANGGTIFASDAGGTGRFIRIYSGHIDALWFGAIGDGSTNDRAACSAADSAAVLAGVPLLLCKVFHISTSLTIASQIIDIKRQIFSTTSAVTLSGCTFVRPEWFGSAAGNIRLAVNALPSTGGTILFQNARYAPSFVDYTTATTGYLEKPGVTFQGAGRPSIKSDGTTLLDGTGTIIDGPFFVAAQSFHAFDLGIDSGSAVCAARYSGTAQEGFFASYYASGSAVYHRDIVVERVSVICKDQASAVHAVLFEQVDGGSLNDILVQYGYHGIVIKSQNVNANGLIARENGGEGLILKSDNYAILSGVNVSDVVCISNDTAQDGGYGVLVEAVSNAGASVNLTNIRVYKKAYGVILRTNGAVLSDVNYSNVVIEGCLYGVTLGGALLRTQGSNITINNATDGLTVEAAVADTSNSINGLNFTNVTTAIKASGVVSVDDIKFNTVTTGFSYVAPATTTRIKVGHWYATSLANVHDLSAALVNSWANFGGGNETFKVIPCNGGYKISGLLNGGSAATITTVPVCMRPQQNMRFTGLAYNGAAFAPLELVLGSNGVLSATNYTAGSSYISLDNVFFIPDRE